MKKEIIGIVAEFNPFHNGHKRLIDIAKKENPNATILVAMSGNFVQRGELAIYDKWTRAKYAIENGCDLIVEIPPYFVLNNSNIFAKKSMEIFNEFNVNKIYFGTENIDINEIIRISKLMIKNEEKINFLKTKHHSLPRAFEEFIGYKLKPNDILGLCYYLESFKMNLKFQFKRVRRYKSSKWSSASKIRTDIWNSKLNSKSFIKDEKIYDTNKYSEIIIGKIATSNTENDLIKYVKNKIEKNKIKTFNELIELCHNKSFTKAKIRREIMKFILELDKFDELIILASNKNGKDLLRDLNSYYFRHNNKNINNYKIENFISILDDELLSEKLKKSTWFKKN